MTTSATLDVAASRARYHRRGVTTLMYASQQGNVEQVRKILRDQPATVKIRDRSGKTPLHYCTTSDSVRAAQAADLLMMAAPDLVDKHDEEGFTPLHLAVIAGNIPLVTFLLANKADVRAVDNEHHTVVHWATVCGETAALSAVLSAGAPVSTPDIHGGFPLHYAAQMCGGEKDATLGLHVLDLLLAHPHISVHVADGDGRPPLLWAASAGSPKAVLALTRAGARVDSADKDGLTALHCAASRGHTDALDTLLTLCGAAPDLIDANGCTALHYAVTLGHADATALLLAHGAAPSRQDRRGRSAAHCGCAKGQLETVKLLGTHGGNLWLRNARGDLPLHEATASGRRELVRWLLDARPSQVNARNNDGRCPLHLAALHDNADMCKILLDSGALVNPILRTSKNKFMTPLDCALQRGFRSTAKFLQLHGGVPATRLGDAKTAQTPFQLNLRDDVTFWGDNSSESDQETKKSMGESGKRLERRYKNEKQARGRVTANKSNSAVSSYGRKSQNGRFDYNNEIVINGKTEINIHQTKEIVISNEGEVTERISRNISTKSFTEENELLEDSMLTTTERLITEAVALKSPKVDSKSKSSPVKLKVPEVNQECKLVKQKTMPDQESMISITSEEVEGQKELIVEAAVHEPPKKIMEELGVQVGSVKDVKEMGVQWEDNVIQVVENKDQIITEEERQKTTVETSKDNVKETMVNEKIENELKDKIEKEETILQEKVGDVKKDAETVVEENKENVKTVKIDTEMVVEEKIEKEETLTREAEKLVETKIDLDSKTKESNQKSEKLKEKQDIDTAAIKIEEEKTKLDFKGNKKEKANKELNNKHKTVEELKPSIKDDLKKEKNQVANVSQNSDVQDEEILAKNQKNSRNEEAQTASKQYKKTRRKKHQSKEPPFEVISKTQSESKELETPRQDYSSDLETTSSTSSTTVKEQHKSFRVLNEQEAHAIKSASKRSRLKKQRSRSDESSKTHPKAAAKSQIPTSLSRNRSKSDRFLHLPKSSKSSLDSRVPSLPNISQVKVEEQVRSESNMSAPPPTSRYSDRASGSELEEELPASGRKRRLKKRSKRSSRSASDYESSNVIDSGFEPSPRSSRIPRFRHMSEKSVNMSSVTQSIQTNIRRYHLERKIFQHLLELKRMQIRAGQHNEAILVKRAIDAYHQSCVATVGAGRYIPDDYSFKNFEKFLYLSLRKLQRNGADHLKGLPEAPTNPMLCTHSTHRCQHATHAYTGVPCAAYLPKMDHHSIPKIGFGSVQCKPGTASCALPTINSKKAVTLELTNGSDKQLISLPADRLDHNKRYYVTFTVKGGDDIEAKEEPQQEGHTHPKSD